MSADPEFLQRRAILSVLVLTGRISGESLLGWMLYGASDAEWARQEVFNLSRTLAALEREGIIVAGPNRAGEMQYRLTRSADRDWCTEVLQAETTETH